MEKNNDLRNKILNRANEICNKQFSISLYELCGLNDGDIDYIKELLVSDNIHKIKAMGGSTFIACIPQLAALIMNNASYRTKDRALRRLYDNNIIITLIEKMDNYIEEYASNDISTIDLIASKLVRDAVSLVEHTN